MLNFLFKYIQVWIILREKNDLELLWCSLGQENYYSNLKKKKNNKKLKKNAKI